jgi:hypothetical protein
MTKNRHLRRLKSLSLAMVAAITIIIGGGISVSAQWPGGLPRIPRPGKPKATPTPAESAPPATTAQPQPSTSGTTTQPQAGGPTIYKTRIQFQPWTINSYKGDFAVWSWIPRVKLNVVGALPSGSHFYVEVAQPGGAAWVKAQCVHQGASTYECGDRDRLKGSETLETGVFRFTIKLRNELAGTDQTYFTGRAKVEKALSNNHGPQAARNFVYYTNHDWNLPIGLVLYDENDNRLRVRFWVRGAQGQLEPHLFYRGQEVTTNWAGQTYSGGRCSSDIEFQPTQYATEKLPQRALWTRIDCRLDGASVKPIEGNADFNTISAKPGEYEVKVLRNRRLSRSIKFTVGPDGNLVDNGVAASIGMAAPDFAMVPVAILDDQDGLWDKSAWKTEALYGNPLAGFTWPPQ